MCSIYLNERLDPAWRARAKALIWLMIGGVGNLIGYLGNGFWLKTATRAGTTHWTQFWGGLAVVIACVLFYFLVAYYGQGTGLRRGAGK